VGVDLTKFSDTDLQALKAGDLSKVSDAGLQALKEQQPAAPEPSAAGRFGAAGLRAMGQTVLKPASQLATLMGALDKASYDAGGWVTDKTGSPELGIATNIGIQTVPAVLGGESLTAAKPLMQGAGRWLMQTAVKPTGAALHSGEAARAIQTLLDEGINVTPGGMAELRNRVGALHKQVEDTIANSSNMVGVGDIPQQVNRTWNRFRYSTINPDATAAEIQRATQDYMSTVARLDPLSEYSGSIPVQLAQKMKRSNQQQLSDEFGSMSVPYYESQKDVTRGLRQGIEAAEPSVAVQNEKMEQLLNALSVTERHALMALNKNPAGLSLLAENPKAAAAFMADRSATFKSLLARMIYAGSERIPQAAGGMGTAFVEDATHRPQ
jgi:hypothetical protein